MRRRRTLLGSAAVGAAALGGGRPGEVAASHDGETAGTVTFPEWSATGVSALLDAFLVLRQRFVERRARVHAEVIAQRQ